MTHDLSRAEPPRLRRAFTLIELLIVVAIIAILAAIAIVNLTAATVRAKISRAKSDLRSIATALESYRVDYGVAPYDGAFVNPAALPPDRTYATHRLPDELSTPVAYLSSSRLIDPFLVQSPSLPSFPRFSEYYYSSVPSFYGTLYDHLQQGPASLGEIDTLATALEEWGEWSLASAGPDALPGPNGWVGATSHDPNDLNLPFDITNGTRSFGDILRCDASPTGYRNIP